MRPAPIKSQSTHFANSEDALPLWALLSQDAGQAAHELSLPDEEQTAHEARLQREGQPFGEVPAAHEL
jgi:hypothetical protein